MAEYELDTDGFDAWEALDYFTKGYVTAMFWTEQEPGTDAESWNPERHSALPGDATPAMLTSGALASIRQDCERFQRENVALLDAYIGTEESPEHGLAKAGIDFWLSRNEHGAGFWDRDKGDTGEKLHGVATAFRESNVSYENGEIHLY